MRLWHYKLLPYLPKSQLVAQWRELNSIFKKQDKHILINYIYEYDKKELFYYCSNLFKVMKEKNIKLNSLMNFISYFDDIFRNNVANFKNIYDISYLGDYFIVFKNHHNNRYLLQCFYNLQEKYDRGQKDFDKETYLKLEEFVIKEVNKNGK